MKVKIIANTPQEEGCSDISKYVGSTFEVIQEYENGNLYVDFYGKELMVYLGEYEWVEE